MFTRLLVDPVEGIPVVGRVKETQRERAKWGQCVNRQVGSRGQFQGMGCKQRVNKGYGNNIIISLLYKEQ